MMGAEYYQTESEIASLLAEGKDLIGVGQNTLYKDLAREYAKYSTRSSRSYKASQVLQPLNGDGTDTKLEGVKETSPTSVFLNSKPIRDDQNQIQNTMKHVPDPSQAVTTTQSVVTNQDCQIKSVPNSQQQLPEQVLQPTPVGPISKMGIIFQFHWWKFRAILIYSPLILMHFQKIVADREIYLGALSRRGGSEC
ncbi:Glucose-1-phosphate adenylyltransferase [Castilleja foliolosa]|uniref:Glucose-1-phosphate adenylyltransferase n=1 Tax=Castilleja foliolosa TaxID=1961234 RepID=A0ABD3BW39_9LAMI